jgi:hypothetical protein
MPAMSLEELLRSSLEGVNRTFQEADQALHAEIATANDALSKISGGSIELKLHPAHEDDSGVVYILNVQAKKAAVGNLGYFGVGQKGYPIVVGSSLPPVALGQGLRINDRTALQAHFHEMASNPDSPLVQKVAFLMRKKQASTAATPS